MLYANSRCKSFALSFITQTNAVIHLHIKRNKLTKIILKLKTLHLKDLLAAFMENLDLHLSIKIGKQLSNERDKRFT